jgi:hypothetical protein
LRLICLLFVLAFTMITISSEIWKPERPGERKRVAGYNTSTDNRYSEAQFKTLKYRPTSRIDSGGSVDRARAGSLPGLLWLVQHRAPTRVSGPIPTASAMLTLAELLRHCPSMKSENGEGL